MHSEESWDMTGRGDDRWAVAEPLCRGHWAYTRGRCIRRGVHLCPTPYLSGCKVSLATYSHLRFFSFMYTIMLISLPLLFIGSGKYRQSTIVKQDRSSKMCSSRNFPHTGRQDAFGALWYLLCGRSELTAKLLATGRATFYCHFLSRFTFGANSLSLPFLLTYSSSLDPLVFSFSYSQYLVSLL